MDISKTLIMMKEIRHWRMYGSSKTNKIPSIEVVSFHKDFTLKNASFLLHELPSQPASAPILCYLLADGAHDRFLPLLRPLAEM